MRLRWSLGPRVQNEKDLARERDWKPHPAERGKHPQAVVVYLEVPECMLRRPAAFKGSPVPVATLVAIEVRQTRDRKPNTQARILTN